VRSSRPGSTTTPGTCRSRTRSSSVWSRRQGRADIVSGGNIEHIQVNTTDPWTEVDGERSSAKTKHPTLSDPAVRQALNLLVDRGSSRKRSTGAPASPPPTSSTPPRGFRLEEHEVGVQASTRPSAILEAAGWKRGSDRRARQDGKKPEIRLPDLDQTTRGRRPSRS